MKDFSSASPSPPLVADIRDFRRGDIPHAGGKAANLGELLGAGFPVPPGFVLTTAAYDLYLETGGLSSRLAPLVLSLNREPPEFVPAIVRTIREEMRNTPVPEVLARELRTWYRGSGGGAVAVRSSATAEDLQDAAFAGQQDTFLDISGDEPLLSAVRDCWQSLWSERAVSYRTVNRIDNATVKIAVIVQRMVMPDAAGVLFTANPITGSREELIIDAHPGNGEAVVSGAVTPDHYVMHKRTHGVLSVERGKPGNDGTRTDLGTSAKSDTGNRKKHRPALPLRAASALSRLGAAIERHFGVPLDIEWAWVQSGSRKGRIRILQARPMTALPDELPRIARAMRPILPILAEMWPERPYPLDMSTFTGEVEKAIGSLLKSMIGRSAPDPGEAFLEDDGVIVRFIPPKLRITPDLFLRPWAAFRKTGKNDPSVWEADPAIVQVRENVRRLDSIDPKDLPWNETIGLFREALAVIPLALSPRERYLPQTLLGLLGLRLLLLLSGRVDRFSDLLSGIRTKTVETNEALEDLAAYIRSRPRLRETFLAAEPGTLPALLKGIEDGREFTERFEAFLTRFGHRETTLAISRPAWRDAPETVLGILRVLSRTERAGSSNADMWLKAREEVLSHGILRLKRFRTLFDSSLEKARSFFRIREDTHFYLTLVQPVLRRLALELGARMVSVGVFADPAMVFHLKLHELEAFGRTWPPAHGTVAEATAIAARRLKKREGLEGKPMVDPRLLAVPVRAGTDTDILVRGTPGSPGRARGTVRIVRSSEEFGNLRMGEVLVAPVTNPSWTPLFRRAAAVVVNTGGVASHAAIVAREYGVPAVMGTGNGTEVLRDGENVLVDGYRGVVLKAKDT